MDTHSPLRLALFQPEPALRESILHLLYRQDQEIVFVQDVRDLIDRLARGTVIDCVVMPLSLAGGKSGIALSFQMKAETALQPLPIVGLLYSSERRLAQAFYESGADTVVVLPCDSELLRLQLLALRRMRRANHEFLARQLLELGTHQLLAPVLDVLPVGIALIGEGQEPLFVNQRLIELLDLVPRFRPESGEGSGSAQGLQHPRAPLPERFFREIAPALSNPPSASGTLPLLECDLSTTSGRMVQALVGNSPLLVETEEGGSRALGSLIVVQSAQQASSARLFAQQLERAVSFLFLYFGAASHLAASQNRPVLLGRVVQTVHQWTADEADEASLNLALTSVIELLDVLLPSVAAVRIEGPSECTIPIARSTLMEILGYPIFLLAKYGRLRSTLKIEVSKIDGNRAVLLQGTVVPPGTGSLLVNDPVLEQFRQIVPAPDTLSQGSYHGIATGYARLEELLRRVGGSLEFSLVPPSNGSFKLSLPLE